MLWYESAKPIVGELKGHTGRAQPIINTIVSQLSEDIHREHRVRSFSSLRLVDPFNRKGPLWEKLPDSALWRPSEHERKTFRHLLQAQIPPGPTYRGVIDEFWNRGFEVFLVGGTVRDVISLSTSNDIDLVTSCPLGLALDVLRPMFRARKLDVNPDAGFCRLGGNVVSGDPFIDVKMVCIDNLGTPNARFGACLETDASHRDFGCNSLYYDPVNEVILDPVGHGLRDVERRMLELVTNVEHKSEQDLAKIAIRFFKFAAKGYGAADATIESIKTTYVPAIASLKRSQLIQYTRTQVLSKYETAEWPSRLQGFKGAMQDFGCGKTWDDNFSELETVILAV